MLVPVYYVDRPASDGRDGEQVRIAVNGQTGRAAAVVFSEKKEIHVQAPLNRAFICPPRAPCTQRPSR